MLLEPLAPEETELLIESLAHLDEGLRERILEAAEGNPLFVEEMVALVQEAGDGDVTVPPTIQALLAARLDQLDASERDVLQCGSVEGRVFHRGAVQALAPGGAAGDGRLTSLVRKELVRPDKTEFAGDDAFRFRHLLIRDAAYDALSKATRAELHERFAAWLAERARRSPRRAGRDRSATTSSRRVATGASCHSMTCGPRRWRAAPPNGWRRQAVGQAIAVTFAPLRTCSSARPTFFRASRPSDSRSPQTSSSPWE